MPVQFTDLVLDQYVRVLGIRRNHIQLAIDNCQQKKIVTPGRGLALNFYSRRLNESSTSPVILAQTATTGDGERVDAAFRLYEDLCPGVFDMSPTQMLFQLLETFGLEIKVGEQIRKIILDERIPLPKSSDTELVRVLNPLNHSYVQSSYVMVEEDKGEMVANCGMVWALDTTRYGAYLASR